MRDKAAALVETAYAAALDDSLWEGWTSDLTTVMGCVCGNFFVLGSGDRPIERMFPIWRGVELVDEYRDHWWRFDPQVTRVASVRRSTIYRSQDHVDERDAHVADFCDWQRARGRFDHHIGLVAMLGEDERKGGVTLHRSVDDGPATPNHERALTAILPEVVRALRLGFQHQAMLAKGFWDGLAARGAGEAMLLIDERGAVIRATDPAAAVVTGGDGLRVTQNRLRAAAPAEDAGLSAIICRAIAPVAAVSGATRIHRPSGKRPYVVIAYPLVRRRRMLAPLEAAALIRILDPSRRTTGSPTLLRDAFGFTPREAELALLLVADHSVESAAAVMGIAVPTARVHLARLLTKTGTGRQADLGKLLLKLL